MYSHTDAILGVTCMKCIDTMKQRIDSYNIVCDTNKRLNND